MMRKWAALEKWGLSYNKVVAAQGWSGHEEIPDVPTFRVFGDMLNLENSSGHRTGKGQFSFLSQRMYCIVHKLITYPATPSPCL